MSVSVEFQPSGAISVRRETDAGAIHREARLPGADLSDLPADVRAPVEALWTPAFVTEFAARAAALDD